MLGRFFQSARLDYCPALGQAHDDWFCHDADYGFLLYYAIPVRTTQSLWFRIKVVLLIVAGINAFFISRKDAGFEQQLGPDPIPPSAYAWVQCCRWSYGLGLSSQAAQSRTTGLTATNNCLTPYWAAGCVDEMAALQ